MPTKPKTLKSRRPNTPRHIVSRPSKPDRWGSGRGGHRWRVLREQVFRRDHFLCQQHLKFGEWVEVALHGPGHGVCDHIIPTSEGGTDDLDNLQTLCQACSRVKTASESARGRGGAKVQG